MAHIREKNGKWCAEVARRGHRKSRTFLTRAEAEAWGDREETRAIRRHQREQAGRESALAASMPRRVLDAMREAVYGAAEITENAVRYKTGCGIYFLILRGEVVYVGQSIDIVGRVAKHRREGKEFDAFNFIECPREECATMEANYILALMPMLNLALGRVPERKRLEAVNA